MSQRNSGAQRTAEALQRWAEALPADSYTVRLVHVETKGRAESRHYSAGELANAAGWLRHRNANGWHVYGRPADTRHILVDDLDQDGLDALGSRHRLAAVVETSAHNFQAWVSLPGAPANPGMATRAARILAARHGGDPGAADAWHLGRLPGLCNRKPMYEAADGRFPWVLLRHAGAGCCPAGHALLREAAGAPPPADAGAVPAGRLQVRRRDPAAEYAAAEAIVAGLLAPGIRLDRSRLDYGVASRLLRLGLSPAQVELVLLQGPKSSGLARAQAQRYARRTIAAARRAVCDTGAAGPA